ncbi:hypothetical protein Salat_1527600 [Sesamum alatum]|uniref:Uncharacterized protein n=1 Tax=Sesamum alatum TaxID=300844 RepID=A0AAE1YCN4_9LAMI|nr:hypothetical protein Salat_1527600 [Sesamum alatum]
MSSAKLSAFSAIRSSVNRKPTSRTTINCSNFDSLFLQCRNVKVLNQILCQMICTGLIKDTYAASRILKFSTELPFVGSGYSYKIFTNIEDSNGFIWNTMLRAFAQGLLSQFLRVRGERGA